MRFTLAFLLPLLLVAPTTAQRLICVDNARVVSEIDMTTGARTTLGTISVNAGTTAGFAYDAVTGRLFCTSSGNDSLYVIDVTNWNATLVGNYGLGTVPVMHGLEWDSSTNTLYGMSSHNTGLYTIDTTTGVATLVGSAGLTSFCNLVYHSWTDTMYMTNSGTDSFYSIDRATGAATLIGPLTGLANPNSMAFNADLGLLYLVDNNTDTLYTVDPTTGVPTTIGLIGSSNVLGLAYIGSAGRLTRAMHGCGPTTITATGHPSPGFTIETEIGATTGLPFVGYGVTTIGLPFCGCTIGHDWILSLFGASSALTIPASPTMIAVQVLMQGMDFLGTGGCVDPQITLTDTITVTIG